MLFYNGQHLNMLADTYSWTLLVLRVDQEYFKSVLSGAKTKLFKLSEELDTALIDILLVQTQERTNCGCAASGLPRVQKAFAIFVKIMCSLLDLRQWFLNFTTPKKQS